MIRKIGRAAKLFLARPDLFALKSRRHLYWQVCRLRNRKSIVYVERGVKFEFDLDFGEQAYEMFWGYYQPDLVVLISDILRAGDTFIDVGGNVGYMSFVAALSVGRHGHIHSFEPVPKYYGSLRRFRHLNPSFDIVVNTCALGAKEEHATICVSDGEEMGYNTMVPGLIDEGRIAERHTVRVMRLEDYVRNAGIDVVRLVKIDTEGYEFEVIRGMGSLIERQARPRPAIICEVVPRFLAAMGRSLEDFSEFMRQLQYVSFWASKAEEPVEITDIDRHCDVLFVPQEWASAP